LALKYGGGESGLARFLKDSSARIAADAKAAFYNDECRFIDKVLADAWREKAGEGGSRDSGTAQRNILGWFDSLDGFGSLDPSQDLSSFAISCLDGQTIKSQASQSYTQWVPLHDVDSAMTICPIGHSDRPESPWRTSTMTLWGEGRLHPAPLGRAAVKKITADHIVLNK